MKNGIVLLLASCLAAAGGAWAQTQPPPTATPLKLTLTLHRPQQGESARASYALYVLADGGVTPTEFRTGREVPVPVTSFVGEAGAQPGSRPVTSFQYRNVGMNLSCRASASEGRFRLSLQLERSSLVEAREPASDPGHPSFHTFNTMTELLLGDGESASIVVGSDPAMGPGWNVEVKLEVVK